MAQMDDGDFQRQLHTLKDRVNALTMQYSPRQTKVWPAAPPLPLLPAGDSFTAQLQDVKAHLNSMQTSFSNFQARMHQQASLHAVEANDGQLAAQSRLTLPSGPVFWQLFNSLRADFRSLDTRVAGLEQDVDALEDRVDRLEPDRFTPPASTTSQDEGGGVQLAQQSSRNLLDASMACLPELCSEERGPFTMPQAQQYRSRVSSLQSQPNNAFQWQWPAATHRYDNSLQEVYATPMLHQRPVHSSTVASPPADTLPQIPPEGVAFRDREIDRMDDQLRAVQESLKSSEALAAAQDTTMNDMKVQIETLQAYNQQLVADRNDEITLRRKHDHYARHLKKELDRCSEKLRRHEDEQRGHLQTIADRDMALRYWQERCDQEAAMFQHTISDRDRALQRWEESYNATNDAWRHENDRANSLSIRLDQIRADRRKEMEQLHYGFERKTDELKEFCEHKDAVIMKQERVMARGARLMEEKDVEIDRLQKRLRAAEDDIQHEWRQQKRMGKLLDERQAELQRLRSLSAPQDETVPDDSLETRQQDQVMTASTEAVDGREPLTIPGSYPREARRSMERRPQRRPRSPNGSNGSEREAARTGSPRRRKPRRHDSSRHFRGARTDTRQDRRPSPPPRPHRLPGPEGLRERHATENGETKPELPDRRRARFLDDGVSFPEPPLPAPVTARKMASEADLRQSHATVERGLAKHQSMQELPGMRQRLQAYVETEGESDAEREVQQAYV